MKRTGIASQIYLDICVSLFVGLFVYAASSKLLEFDEFRIQLSRSPMLTKFAELYVWLIPLLEITIAVLLIFRKTRQIGLYGFYTLMLVFTFYIVAITQYSFFVPCSCGGVLTNLGWTEHLYFNIAFIILGAAAILLQTRKKYSDSRKQGVAENL